MNVGKAWHYLLIHPEKGYYTGYKGQEAFGDLESARIYRTEQEAHMARLKAGMEVRVESCLLWHSSRQTDSESDCNSRSVVTNKNTNNLAGTNNAPKNVKKTGVRLNTCSSSPVCGFKVIDGDLPDKESVMTSLGQRRSSKPSAVLTLIKSS